MAPAEGVRDLHAAYRLNRWADLLAPSQKLGLRFRPVELNKDQSAEVDWTCALLRWRALRSPGTFSTANEIS